MSQCPECLATVDLQSKKVYAGEVVTCKTCQTQLEIISPEPLTLALAPEVEEDWGE